MEKLTFNNLGKHQNGWATVYIEPNNNFSKCGGRITVIFEDYIGSAFFSHCGTNNFKEFIAKSSSGYLMNKLFNQNNQIPDSIFIEDGDEIIELIEREKYEEIKLARVYGDETLSKEALRNLHNALSGEQFDTAGELYRHLDSDEQETMDSLFGEEWGFDSTLKKENPNYIYVKSMIDSLIAEFKKLSEVVS
ncbi:hypothetical protein [Acinetobacter pittii]|uniref:DUF4375 domain-containing protein n=1 Tax=Acinetobacter pittii TaxID=48296 RepID=A0A3R9QH03_ACIPI|nr:hypothetical protein [Acinetobacter pittii]HEM6651505.1 hypothetical protein [Acinetobacter baumannii]KQE17070.1 hypothetical protein APD36_16490 [Acinetobacter pittii]KRI47690.1 hypothetical protein APC42_10060 [Acinetobacter pittii]RSO51588.1 hypothetical protein EA758_14900 [Acinetobacter pittii]RSO57857.1 hypothetical protein EA752_14655 [Acinetobacter pittii]